MADTPLAALLAARITQEGPMRLSDFMAECLLHPDYGYYTQSEPFGAQGDFITAPEISQMFGELLGLTLAQAWLDQGAPSPFTLLELGPGRGTLMADLWRATAKVPGFHAAARLYLFEASPRLRALQAETLVAAQPRWCDDLNALPQVPLFVIANEFFDALPVRQFTRREAGWAETEVGLKDGALTLGQGRLYPPALLPQAWARSVPGDVAEWAPQMVPLLAPLAARIADQGGLALILDYGAWAGFGDTVQALRAHRPEPILQSPGLADLTAHVDFAALAEAAAPCAFAYETQGAFLKALGIETRAARLAAGSPDAAADIKAALHRLTAPQEMGSLFKALALFPEGAPLPPGFARKGPPDV